MVFQFDQDLGTDLLEADVVFRRSIRPWWQEIQPYIELIQLDHTWKNLPGFVLAIYRELGLNKDFSLAMTNIFKMLYLSVFIHELIGDDAEGQEHNQTMQFSILIGDYMFGRVLALLIKAEADMLVPVFADMICEINEGMVSRYKLGGSRAGYLKSSRASFYKNAFFTAAICAGKNVEEQELYRQAGYRLGIAAEFFRDEELREEAQAYLEDSAGILTPERNYMESIYEEMRRVFASSNKLAAV